MKKGEERRRNIIGLLTAKGGAYAGGDLAEKLKVSRQIIVHDISLLREEGYEIVSTHTGYVLKSFPQKERIFKVHHTSEQTKDELLTIVALGGTVIDVHVDHKVYGKVSAVLNLFSERGVDRFIEEIKSGKSSELMHITAGYHYHSVRAKTEEILDGIEKALEEKGYLVKDEK